MLCNSDKGRPPGDSEVSFPEIAVGIISWKRTSGPRRHAVVSTPTRDLNRTGRSSRMITCDMAISQHLSVPTADRNIEWNAPPQSGRRFRAIAAHHDLASCAVDCSLVMVHYPVSLP